MQGNPSLRWAVQHPHWQHTFHKYREQADAVAEDKAAEDKADNGKDDEDLWCGDDGGYDDAGYDDAGIDDNEDALDKEDGPAVTDEQEGGGSTFENAESEFLSPLGTEPPCCKPLWQCTNCTYVHESSCTLLQKCVIISCRIACVRDYSAVWYAV